MPRPDTDRLLAMLRDPNVESRDIAAAAGVSREEAGRAARLVLGIAKAKPEEVATLPGPRSPPRAATSSPRSPPIPSETSARRPSAASTS